MQIRIYGHVGTLIHYNAVVRYLETTDGRKIPAPIGECTVTILNKCGVEVTFPDVRPCDIEVIKPPSAICQNTPQGD